MKAMAVRSLFLTATKKHRMHNYLNYAEQDIAMEFLERTPIRISACELYSSTLL